MSHGSSLRSGDFAYSPLGYDCRTAHSHAAWSARCASMGQDHFGGYAIIEVNEQVTFAPFPVTVTYLPVTRCQICRRTVAYRPGSLSEVLTEHYRRAHPEALGLPSR